VDSCIYHTLEWKSIIERTYDYKPYYVVAKDDAKIIGALPLFEVRSFVFGRRLVSIPFSHRVPVLYQNDVPILEKLLEFACDLTRVKGCKYLEIKHGAGLALNMGVKVNEHFFNSVLDLSGTLDDLWHGFDSGSVRWGINRAKRSHLEIEKGSTLEDYRKYHRLELETRKVQGVPPYPFRFFRNLRDHLGSSHKLRLYLAYLDDVCVAGIIVLCHNGRAIYGYSSSLKKREYLQIQPNNLLLWTALQELHSDGYREFDFGITHPSNEGLLRFKSHWGTRDYKIPYHYFLNKIEEIPVIDRTSRKIRLASPILKALPTPILEWIGPHLLRHVG